MATSTLHSPNKWTYITDVNNANNNITVPISSLSNYDEIMLCLVSTDTCLATTVVKTRFITTNSFRVQASYRNDSGTLRSVDYDPNTEKLGVTANYYGVMYGK